jgi:hypothetical protein
MPLFLFFAELGLELEGRATIEGDWAERVTGLRHMRVEIGMMRTPDGHSRLEISRFLSPPAVADHCVTSEALRGSSSGWPSRSASGLNFRDGRAPQAPFPNAGPPQPVYASWARRFAEPAC